MGWALLACLLLSACSGSATTVPVSPIAAQATPPRTAADLLTQLSRAAAEVRPGAEPAPELNGASGQTMWIGDEQVWVYELEPPGQAAMAQLLSGHPERKLWHTESLLVAYDGYNGGVILVLSSALGDPLQPQAPVQDEPYPPAVVAALQRVAQQAGVTPQEVIISAFEPADWANDCLGLPRQDDDCEGEGGPGWRIQATVAGRPIEIHTDALAANLRLQPPLELTGTGDGP